MVLGTACIWRAASPSTQEGVNGAAAASQLDAVLAHKPAMEVFSVLYVPERTATYYPFTNAFYDSDAYKKYRKHHFSDLMLHRTMADVGRNSVQAPERSAVLWDSRFVLA